MSAANEWGYGAAKLLKPSTKESIEVVAFLSDIHVPYQDPGVVESALALVRDLQPHRVVINGDVCDFVSLSRFSTSLDRFINLQAEINEANEFRAAVREAAPNAELIEVEGNHDARLTAYIKQNAAALSSLEALDPKKLYRYGELGIQWVPGAGFLQRPEFLVKHGTFVRWDAGASAKAEYAQAGISGISGHTHRLGAYRRSGYIERQWTEQGCLCRLDPEYITGAPNWAQGMCVGHFSTKSDAFVVETVQTFDGRLFHSGRLY